MAGSIERVDLSLRLEKEEYERRVLKAQRRFLQLRLALGGQLDRVVVTEVRNHTYFAELHLRSGGAESVVSSRPSDAIALAVRSGAPIFVSEPLLDAEGQVPADDSDDEETILDEFRDFLDDLDPDDFAD